MLRVYSCEFVDKVQLRGNGEVGGGKNAAEVVPGGLVLGCFVDCLVGESVDRCVS